MGSRVEMSMIYIKEMFHDERWVSIRVDGILDAESVKILKDVCDGHLEGEKKVQLHLESLLHISREGRDFLKEIQNKVLIVEPPQFIKKDL